MSAQDRPPTIPRIVPAPAPREDLDEETALASVRRTLKGIADSVMNTEHALGRLTAEVAKARAESAATRAEVAANTKEVAENTKELAQIRAIVGAAREELDSVPEIIEHEGRSTFEKLAREADRKARDRRWRSRERLLRGVGKGILVALGSSGALEVARFFSTGHW